MKTRRISYSNSQFHFVLPLTNSLHQKIYAILRICILLFGLIGILTFTSQAQNLDVPYVPTPNDVVERMLEMAEVGPGDYVIDLGSGDGRIVIAAAKRGAVGHGVDIDPERIQEARENAREEEVDDRIMFLQEDIFETDFTKASVVTMYLLSSINRELRPSLLAELRPGTRIISHSFDMDDWKPDNFQRYANRNIYFWIIPARVAGENWKWETNDQSFSMVAKQEFQEINVQMFIGNRNLTTKEATLRGKRINLIAYDDENDTRYIYSGQVEDGSIIGTVQVHDGNSKHIEEWSTTLSEE